MDDRVSQRASRVESVIQSFLNEGDVSSPIRIIGDAPTKILDPEDHFKSVRVLITVLEEAIHKFRPDIQTRFLAACISPVRHTYFVVNLNNTQYDWTTAHHNTTPIPVYVLRLFKKPRIFQFQPEDERLAVRLAEMHNGHGSDPLPLVEDFTKHVQYAFPAGSLLVIFTSGDLFEYPSVCVIADGFVVAKC